MAEPGLLIYSSVVLLVGIYLFFKGFKWLNEKRLIENLPTSKIRSLAMGLVEVYGKVVPAKNHLLQSPFLNEKCVYYKYTIEEYRRSGKHGRWRLIDDGEKGRYFYLKDDSGFVLIDLQGAKIDIPRDFESDSGFGVDPPTAVKHFLKARNLGFEGFFGINKTMRFSEYLIAPNDKLYIIGTAGDNPFIDEALAKKGAEDVMVQKGAENKHFYISDKNEREILKSLKWKAFGGIFGGSALIVGCLALILLFFEII
ncbi:MAG: GIDE domain-containing protein [Nanoarchaeota archaeon]